MQKKWYASKTLWVNVLTAISLFISQQFGVEIPNYLIEGALIGINVLLRLITKEGLTL